MGRQIHTAQSEKWYIFYRYTIFHSLASPTLSPISLLLSPHSLSTHYITPPPLSHSFSSLTISFIPSSLLLPTLSLHLSQLPLSHSPSSTQMHSLFSFSYYHSHSTLPSLLSKSPLSLSLTPFLSPSLNALKHSNSNRCYLSFMN